MRRSGVFQSCFAAISVISLLLQAPALWGQGCSFFSETFGPPAGHDWHGAHASWSFSNGKLWARNIDPAALAYAETAFSVPGSFRIDVEVSLDTPSGDGAVGIYPFTSGDALIGVGNWALDGVAAMVFASGNAYLLGWDPIKGEWYQSEPYRVPGTVGSIGLHYSSSRIVLRINGADTPLQVTGQFALVPSLLDTVWLLTQGDATTTVSFDNVCASPEATAPPNPTPSAALGARFVFPYYQALGGSFTGFAVSNHSNRSAQLQFRAYDTDGDLLPFPGNPRTFELAANKQLALLGNEIFGVAGSAIQQGWVELTSDNRDLGSFFQVGEAERLDGSVSVKELSRRLFFTRVYEGNGAFRGETAATFISLVNPNSQPASVQLSLKGTGSDRTITRNLPAYGCLYGTLSEIFGRSLTVRQGYLAVEVTSGAGLAGFALLQLPRTHTWVGLNATPANPTNRIYSAQLASLAGFFTSVKLVNTGTVQRHVTLSAISEDGGDLAAPVTLTLAAGQVYEGDAATIFGWNLQETKVGSLQVEADGPDVVGDVVFGDSARLLLAAALPLQNRLFTEGIFSQVANALGLYTGLAFYNPGESTAQITIEVYREDGGHSGTKTISLGAGRRISKLLTEYLPETNGQVKGYVKVRSTQPIVAQQLFGAANLLSAVPPTLVLPTISGPGGIFVQLADQADQRQAPVSLHSDSMGQLTEPGERPVSNAVKISVGNLDPLQGDGFFTLSIPVTAADFDPGRLTGKVRLSTGVILPLAGTYNAGQRTYEIQVPSLVNGWVLGVVESETMALVEVGSGGVALLGTTRPQGWLTPVDWETCQFHPIRHTNKVSNKTIRSQYAPTMEEACLALAEAGFRSPKLWITSRWNDEELDAPGRIVHFVDSDGSFFRGNWIEEDPQFTEVQRSEEEMLSLGQIYLDVEQLEALKEDWGMGFGNVFSHELFHAVQFGYDFRRGATYDGEFWRSSHRAYTEGTATALGQTFQEGNGSVTGPEIWVRELRDGESTPLDEPIDNYWSNYYRKQDFWAWVAKRYGNNSWAFTNQVFEQMGMTTYGQFGKSTAEYVKLYRQGTDRAFKDQFGKGFAELYREFALDRAYEHSSYALHRQSERDGWKKNRLATSLFRSFGYKLVNPTSSKAEERQAQFSPVPALSTFAARIQVPAKDRDAGVITLRFTVTGGQVKTGGIEIYVFAEGADSVMQSGGEHRVTKIDDPVEIPVNDRTAFLTVLIINTDLGNEAAKVTVNGTAKYELLFFQSDWEDTFALYGTTFEAAAAECISAEFTVYDADKELPPGIYLMFRYPDGSLLSRWDAHDLISTAESGQFSNDGKTWKFIESYCYAYVDDEGEIHEDWGQQPRGAYTVEVQDQDRKLLISKQFVLQ
ncbi:MAG: hypothetical protein Kow00109_28690 [Acidobacteriota bacterium]